MTAVAVSAAWPLPLPGLARARLLSAINKADAATARQPQLRLAAAAGSDRPPDGQGFAALMLPHLDAAYTFARYLTRGDAASEDLVHDAYMRALRAFPGFRGGDAKAWIFAIVRNCFMTWAKARNGEKTTADEQALADVVDERTPEGDLARSQEARTMRRLIDALPPQLAEIIVLREIEDLSYREIAHVIDVPIGTVMSRLARARSQLAEAWRAESEAGA